MELRKLCALGLDPFRGTGLHSFHNLGDAQSARQAEEQVRMINEPSHFQRWTIVLAQNHREVRIQFLLNIRRQDGDTVFGAEDEVNKKHTQRLANGWGGCTLASWLPVLRSLLADA